MLSNQGIAQIIELITELLTAVIGKNAKFKRKNKDSNLIDIAHCKICRMGLPDIEYAILIRYNY
jgi:hypothetical protein